jgi:hypothetical protein
MAFCTNFQIADVVVARSLLTFPDRVFCSRRILSLLHSPKALALLLCVLLFISSFQRRETDTTTKPPPPFGTMIFVRELVRGGKSKSIRKGVKKNFGFLKP